MAPDFASLSRKPLQQQHQCAPDQRRDSTESIICAAQHTNNNKTLQSNTANKRPQKVLNKYCRL